MDAFGLGSRSYLAAHLAVRLRICRDGSQECCAIGTGEERSACPKLSRKQQKALERLIERADNHEHRAKHWHLVANRRRD